MSEQRREPRQRVVWPLQAAGISGKSEGTIANASLCGFLFEADVEFHVKELVVLRVNIEPDVYVDCVVQIVRAESQGNGMIYGADLRHISAADRQKLSFALLVLK